MMENEKIVIFKLFNSIKDKTEVEDFAKLEIEGLTGIKPKKIKNFYDLILESPIDNFTTEDIRIQDMFTNELPYGKIQGYFIKTDDDLDIRKLIRRLGYTREIFLINQEQYPEKHIKKIVPNYLVNKAAEYYQNNDYSMFRFVTFQYMLEKSQYVSKLSRNESEIEDNVNTLINHVLENQYRIPSSSTKRIGKRLEDYFAIREELSLYLTHYMHPYKGKFHPKMVRSLLNYVAPDEDNLVMDNFAGSGTLLLEASLMGLDSIGVEINPLSVLMSNVKTNILNINSDFLDSKITDFLKTYKNKIKENPDVKNDISDKKVAKSLKSKTNIDDILIAKNLINDISDKKIKEFLLLSLSGSISDSYRRRKKFSFCKILEDRINDLYNDILIFHKLNEYLDINVGTSTTYIGDTRDLISIEDIKEESIDGIINSPPYSTALDYVKNDKPQLEILNLSESLDDIDDNMIGNPRKNYDSKALKKEINDKSKEYNRIHKRGHYFIERLIDGDRWDAALRCYNFFKDMDQTAQEMYKVLKPGGKCIIIIGNNNFKVNGEYLRINNSRVIYEQCKKAGFRLDKIIERELEKSSSGRIREETILILKK